MIDLIEVSMDDNLHDNAVSMVISNNVLSSSVAVYEGDDVVMVTFITTTSIHVLELPHPLAITKVTLM